MATFQNLAFTENEECTNVVFCQADSAPAGNWVECSADDMAGTGVSKLYMAAGVRYFGYL